MGRGRAVWWVAVPLVALIGTSPLWGGALREARLASVASPKGIGEGRRVPDLRLPTLSHNTVSTGSFAERPWVLTFASCSCPHSSSTAAALKAVKRRFADLPILTVYVREAHPDSKFPLTFTFEETEAAARSYQRLTQASWTIALDSTSGRFHSAMGELPNGTYIIDGQGRIVRAFSFMPPVYVFAEALKEVLGESAQSRFRLANASDR